MDLIIGGGISGLSYAAFTEGEYRILERESELGGYCRTIKQDGFTWDFSGHFFHFKDSEIKAFVLKNIDLSTLRTVTKQTQIYYNGIYIDFPFQKNIHQLPKEEFIDCLYDLFKEKKKSYGNSFKEMVRHNLGDSIAEKFLIPYNEKLYACDLDNLDGEAMGRFFPKASREEIVRNFRNHNNSSYNDTFVYPTGGAESYVKSIANRLDHSRIDLNSNAVSIDLEAKRVQTNTGESISYDRLISTVPFPNLLQLCQISCDYMALSANKVVVFNLGFDSPSADQKNSWVYFPGREFVFYRVGYYSNIIRSERTSLYVEIGLGSNEAFSEKELLQTVLKDLKQANIISSQKLVSYSCVIMDPAYVHINQQGIALVKEYKEMLASHSVYSIGRYGSWTYCSIEDNILEARELAKRLK